MFRSPNKEMKRRDNKIFNPFQLGDNQIAKKFQRAFNVLLSSEYYEGTDLGKFYNERREDGRSKIYVDQEELEKRVYREFINIDKDITKFLVGYTGVGKTTLLRNIFQIFDRDVNEIDNNLVIYFSFYSMSSARSGEKKDIVQKAVIDALEMAITYLSGLSYAERLISYNDEYYKGLFEYIYENNKMLIHSYRNSPKYTDDLNEKNIYRVILNWLEDKDPFDYTLCQLKYYLKKYEEKNNRKLKNIILIFDDIEAKSIEYHNEVIELAWHIKKCLQAFKDREYNFKCLITLRNYSFRMQQIRLKEAFREINKNDVILKDQVPNLSEVIGVRLKYVLQHKKILESVKEPDTWKQAAEKLDLILSKLYGQYDKMLLSLTHNDIFKSMSLLMRIITNKNHLGKYEIFNDGAFVIIPEKYNVINYSNNPAKPGNDDVFYSLLYGEREGYEDVGDYYLTNIMHFKKNEGVETELMGIYIIQFLICKGIYMGNDSYDGFQTKEGKAIVEEILEIFDLSTSDEKEIMRRGLEAMMKKLYEGGALLQSIIEPQREDGNAFFREYSGDLRVYLSLRGYQLYQMLKSNSLLFEAYRDDIDTELEDNDMLTLKLSKFKRIKYCLQYTSYLFRKEIYYLRNNADKSIYVERLGVDIGTVVLMEGLRESILVYYNFDSQEKKLLTELYNNIAVDVNDYLEEINAREGIILTKVQIIN